MSAATTVKAKVLEAVRDLAPGIEARAQEIEAARRLPLDLVASLKEAGVVRMFVPESHGGGGVDLRTGLDVLETLARADGATGWTMMIASESPQLFALLAREEFDAIYAQGPDVILGGAFNPQGAAEVTPEGYRVNGRWGFASGCDHCDWLFANCVVMENGRPRPGAAEGVPEVRCVLLRPEPGRIVDTWHVLGLRGTGSKDIAVEDARVAARHSFDLFGGQPSIPSPSFVGSVLHCALHMGAVALGIAQGALDETVALARGGKRRLYARVPLLESQLFQHRLGRAAATLQAARAALHTTADRFWAACVQDPAAVAALAPQIPATLTWVAEAAIEVVDTCYRAGGASGLRDGTTMQRRFRDIHTFSQHAAVAEGWFIPAGGALLGLPAGLSN